MDNESKQFHVWLFRERGWIRGDAGRKVGTGYGEPAEAADAAEMFLKHNGVPNQSYAELRFNGEFKPHTIVCYLDAGKYGIWNTENVKWPVYYPPDDEDDVMLAEFPFDEAEDGAHWNSDEGDMKLDDEETADKDEPEADSGKDAEDDPSDDGNGSLDDDSQDTDDGEDSEDDGEDMESDEDDSDDEGEGEMPRLRIFAKMRGAVGWRKRAETEELFDKNTFILKLGVLDEDAEKAGAQEREVFAQVHFVETDEDREGGILKMKLPTVDQDLIELEHKPGGWYQIRVPYRQEED